MEKKKITVIKVGGKIVEEKASLAALLDRFAAVEGAKVLIHGGGRSATKIAESLGIESKMVNGRRITDEPMLQSAPVRPRALTPRACRPATMFLFTRPP